MPKTRVTKKTTTKKPVKKTVKRSTAKTYSVVDSKGRKLSNLKITIK